MAEARVTGGVFEVGVGVKDIDRALAYWRSFGYRPGPLGTLGAGEAGAGEEVGREWPGEKGMWGVR